MTRHVAVVAAGLASLALAGPAVAQTAPPPPPTAYYFTCGDHKVHNGRPAAQWSTTAPAFSFQSGAGCGFLDPGPDGSSVGGPRLQFAGGGTHSGVINAINVELHSLLLSRVRVPADWPGVFELVIDGQPVLTNNTLRIAGEVSPTGLTEKYVFSFARTKTGGTPVAPPLAGEGDHTIEVRFSSRTVEYQNAWVWGASEVPAHVVVNPARTAGVKITG